METLKQETVNSVVPITTQQKEKERLELMEKRVEIQKKRMEIKKEKLTMDEILVRRNISLDEQKLLIEKITELRNALTDWVVDDERTIMASDPFLTPILTGERREVVIRKLIELIKRV